MKHAESSKTLFSSIQWLFFIFANTVVVPLSVGTAFDVQADVMKMMLSYSFVFTGMACILQGWMGHRYPLMEGHSGLLWGVMLNLGVSASALGMSYTEIGGGVATGILLSGVVVLLLAAFNLISIVQKIFPQMVMTVYLFLLTFQLIFVFFEGMLGITEQGTIDVPVSLLSITIVILVSVLKVKGSTVLSNFSILIGIVVGWILYVFFFPDTSTETISRGMTFSFFPLGAPNLEIGIVVVAFFAGLMNLSNTVASIQTAATLYKEESNQGQYRRSFLITGLFSFVAAAGGLVPYTPFTSSIGFLQSTRILEKKPFFIGGGLLTLAGFIPPVAAFLVTMPITIGNAVLFVAYLQLFGTAYNSLKGTLFNSNTIFRLAMPVLIGVSLMNISPAVFSELPILFQPFLSNGLIMGVFLSIVMEKVVDWEQYQ
ncbi:uracil/xanthine transporter [Metabacillus iocasae]|uniref:Xanthine/uracil permease n=1 Tax=Priestia iocasae TaxID=2291674 RepID=A0ABS2R176_9BACI|nr:uracil/xanthine transporter [Metabacillus iocasae]MBM7705007.1 xanthine/uracil permease [Metabacillus iocasae]